MLPVESQPRLLNLSPRGVEKEYRTPSKRVAIYARVSTFDKGQDPETQLLQLREYAGRRGFEIVDEYVDYGTGRTDDRANYKRLWDDARKRKVDVVLVFRWSRFARSTQALITALDEFGSLGVDFISFHEGSDTATPQGRLLFTIMAALAQFESDVMGENIQDGMARARAQGKHLGRPRIPEHIKSEIERLRAQRPPVSPRWLEENTFFGDGRCTPSTV